jgi:predicted TIM-barrel fold metal-dependent hydrolase
MQRIIDPHIHLFELSQGDYHWLKPENPPYWHKKSLINRTIHQPELVLQPPFELAGFVHIEAGFDNQQPWREIAWLESHVTLPFRSVSCCNLMLSSLEFSQQLTKILSFQSVVGCRHILDEQADKILSTPQTINNLAQLAQHQLLFEAQLSLLNANAVAQLIELMQQLPELVMVINHAGFPPTDVSSIQFQQWQLQLQQLSMQPNCLIKVSGFELFNQQANAAYIEQIVMQCLNHFGEKRVMLASNFPLCLFRQNYQQTWQQLRNLLNSNRELASVQQYLLHDTAYRCYQLNAMV